MTDLCPFCCSSRLQQSLDRAHWRQGEYVMFTCENCNTETAWPRLAASSEVYDHEMPEDRWEFGVTVSDIAGRRNAESILDIGCGKGDFLRLATSQGLAGVGIDFNHANVEAARARGLDCRVADLISFSGNRRFASVSSFHVIEHLEDPRAFLLMIKDVLKSGGALYVSFPCRERDIVRFMRDIADYPPHHMNRISDRGLRSLAEQSGFKVIDQRFEPRSITWTKATSLTVNRILDKPNLRRKMTSMRVLNYGLKAVLAIICQPMILWNLFRYRKDPGFSVLYKLESKG